MPLSNTKSGITYAKRKRQAAVLRPLDATVASLTSSSAATPHQVQLNMCAWNGNDRFGSPSHCHLHPSSGLHSWSHVVSELFAACNAGTSEGSMYLHDGTLVKDYETFLIHFAKQHALHAKRWKYVEREAAEKQKSFVGPKAPILQRAVDDAVGRIFDMDIVCCSKGTPFHVPQLLQKKIKRWEEIDEGICEDDAHGTVAERARTASPTRRAVHGPRAMVEKPLHVMASFANASKRRDNPIVVRLESSSNKFLDDGEADISPMHALQPALSHASFRLRRVSTQNALLASVNKMEEQAQDIKRQLMSALRREDVPDGALNSDATAMMQDALLPQRRSFVGDEVFSPSRLNRSSFVRNSSSLRRVGGSFRASSPLAKTRTPSTQLNDTLDDHSLKLDHSSASSAATSPRAHSPTHDAPLSNSLHSKQTGERSSSAAYLTGSNELAFPLGVVRNRHGELVKIDGGRVCPGAVVTSSITGELYKVEYIDVKSNTAHCRWVVRAMDPYLSSFVRCSEDSLIQGMTDGEHFLKYRFHWLARMNISVENRPSLELSELQAVTTLDDTMLQYGELPEGTDALRAFGRYVHHGSPVAQRRMQRHGGQSVSVEDDSDEDNEDITLRSNATDSHHGTQQQHWSEEELLIVKDFEALFPSHRDHIKLCSEVHRAAPRCVVSEQVSFLTDVCVPVLLSVLKPTTTFRFFMWVDIGFVSRLTHLLNQYALRAETDRIREQDCFLLPIPCSDLKMNAMVSVRHMPNRVHNEYGKADPIEGCMSHETPFQSGRFLCPTFNTGDRCFVCDATAAADDDDSRGNSPTSPTRGDTATLLM